MADYKRQKLNRDGETGYHLYDDSDPLEDRALHIAATGPQPYIPPVVEDPDLPVDYNDGDESNIYENGQPPMKRSELNFPEPISYDGEIREFNFKDGTVDKTLPFPDISFIQYNYETRGQLENFIFDNIPIENPKSLITQVKGPFDKFNTKMCTVELKINQRDFHFDGFRPIVPDIGYAIGLATIWAFKHMDRVRRAGEKYAWYKAMMAFHCVFIKTYENNEREYRRFIFDGMCDDDNGKYLKTRSPNRLFKMIYNKFVKMAYEKLDMRNCTNVPNIDSRYEFYAIEFVNSTLFKYNPIY